MSKKKSQFVLMATYFADVEEDGTVETENLEAPVLLGVFDRAEDVIGAISNLFVNHERRLEDLFTDLSTAVERLSFVSIYTPEIPKGIQVSFYEPTGSKKNLALRIEKALRDALKKTVSTKKKV